MRPAGRARGAAPTPLPVPLPAWILVSSSLIAGSIGWPFSVRYVRQVVGDVQLGVFEDQAPDVAGDRLQVVEVEPGRRDRPGDDLAGMVEEVAVVGRVAAEPGDDAHPADATRAAGALGVVGRAGGDVPHGDRFQVADVDAHLQGRRAGQQVRAGRRAVHEAVLGLLAVLLGHGRRVLGGEERRGVVLHGHQGVQVSLCDRPWPGDHPARTVRAVAGVLVLLVRGDPVADRAAAEGAADLELELVVVDLVTFPVLVLTADRLPGEIAIFGEPAKMASSDAGGAAADGVVDAVQMLPEPLDRGRVALRVPGRENSL